MVTRNCLSILEFSIVVCRDIKVDDDLNGNEVGGNFMILELVSNNDYSLLFADNFHEVN